MKDLFESINQNISELSLQSIPAGVDMDCGFESANRVLDFLWDIVNNPVENKKMYMALEDSLFSKNDPAIPYKNLEIEVYPEIKIPVFFYLRHTHKGEQAPAGRYAPKRNKAKIQLALQGDPREQRLVWLDQEYTRTMEHEVTHAYQYLALALRFARFKGRPIKDINKIIALISGKVQRADRNYRDKNNIPHKDPGFNRDPEGHVKFKLAYYGNTRELGANARMIANALKKDFGDGVLNTLHGHFYRNDPDFYDIDKDLYYRKYNCWTNLTALSQQEQRLFGIRRIEDTRAYEIKQQILRLIYDILKKDYKRR